MVLWLIGKSGAGKTRIGRALFARLRELCPCTVFLDGDELRAAIGEELGYDVHDRRRSERRTSRLCKLLADQGCHVICAKLSNAPEVRAWNAAHLDNYREIFIDAPQTLLETCDDKGLYRRFALGETANVVGADILFHPPRNPWMTVWNDRTRDPDTIAESILANLLEEVRV